MKRGSVRDGKPGRLGVGWRAPGVAVLGALLALLTALASHLSAAWAQPASSPNTPATPARIVELQPTQSVLEQGAGGWMQLRISAPQPRATVATLSSSAPNIVRVAAVVSAPAHQVTVNFQVHGQSVGNAQGVEIGVRFQFPQLSCPLVLVS